MERVTGAAGRLAALVLVAAAASGCRPGSGELAPPEIRYGEDTCADCNMIISDVRFAAAFQHEVAPGRYESLAFDDIADMISHAARRPELRVAAWYVHDHGTEAWIDAAAAHYVRSPSIQSPMASGVAAFEMIEDAQALADETGGALLDWEGLRRELGTGGARQGAGR